MPNQSKFEAVAEIKGRFDGAATVILADYRGLSVKEMQAFRTKLREAGGEVKVYKNSLTEIALRELGLPDLGEMLDGPTAFVFAPDDPVAAAKALADFAKEHAALELKGGLLDKVVTDAKTVAAIASLPSREELLAKLMGMLNSPVRGFMAMANAPAAAFVRTLKAVADQQAAAA